MTFRRGLKFTVLWLLTSCMPLQPAPPSAAPTALPSIQPSQLPSPTPSASPVPVSPSPTLSPPPLFPPTPRPTGDPVEVVAGSGQTGFQNGPALQASFNQPAGLCASPTGELFIMDTHQIRKLSPDGIVSTLTGSQEAGYRDGSLQEARFNQVIDCSVDQEGNLLVVDDGNHRIRHISPNGFVSTLIGNGLPAVQDGNREQASLGYSLSDIQPLPDGILFVADGKYLREFKNGELKTLNKNEQLFQYQTDYLDGPVEKATFGDSLKLTADNEGNLFIADFRVKKLRVMSKDKIVSTLSQDVHQVGEKYGEDFINYWIPQPIDVVFDPFRHKLYVSTTKTIYESQLTGEAKIIADPYLASKEGKNFPFDSVGGGLAFGQDRQLYFTDYKAKRIGRVLLPSP